MLPNRQYLSAVICLMQLTVPKGANTAIENAVNFFQKKHSTMVYNQKDIY